MGFLLSNASAASLVHLSTKTDHPAATIKVDGRGYAANEDVDVYWDTTDVLLAVTNSTGSFSRRQFQVPANATPGQHWVTATGRTSGDTAQMAFTVSTTWAEFGFIPQGGRNNLWENVISPSNVGTLSFAWSVFFGGYPLTASAAYRDGVVYITANGEVAAIKASSGVVLWTASIGALSSPALAKGVLYVGSGDDNLYALNESTGATLWTVTTGAAVESSPAVGAGQVFVGSDDGFLYAVSPSGVTNWSMDIAASVYSSPAVYGSGSNTFVYSGSDSGNFWCFLSNGVTNWFGGPGGEIYSSPAVANGVVYYGTTDSRLCALDSLRGGPLWTATTGGAIYSSPAVANGVVYVGSDDDNLYAFNAHNGAVLWTATTGGPINSSPAVANGVVYVGSWDQSLYAFNATNGAMLWSATTGVTIESSPIVADGMVFASSDDGYFYAFALNAGNAEVYKRERVEPPSPAMLHPDQRLRPTH